MAKIENTTVYPLTTPSVDDFIIGTDTSDENRTVSFSIESITATSLLQGLQSVLDTSSIATQNIRLTGDITVSGTVYPTTITAVGSTGTAGQLLSSTATGIQWIDVPINPCCTLDDTLNVGNTTTRDILTTGSIGMIGAAQGLSLVNGSIITLGNFCSITTDDDIRLNLATCVLDFNYGASISDGNSSLGTSGQIFTRGPAGVEWATGIPSASMPTLQEVLNAGNTATGVGASFSGAGSTFSVSAPITSYAPNVWYGTNSFLDSGTAIDTAGIALSGSLWDGASTGTTSQVLTSTVTGVQWQDVSAVGVSSVTTTTPIDAASPQTPITINPTSGAVLVTQNIYNGGALIGCVPDGGTNSTFLRGDGAWVVPAGGSAPSGFMSYLLCAAKTAFVASNYYTLASNNTPSSGDRTVFTTDLGASDPATMAATMTDLQHVAGCFLSNPTGDLCGSAYPKMKVCDMDFQFIADTAAATHTWVVQLWKTSRCTSGTYTLAGTISFPSPAADTLYCGAITWTSTALQTLDPGEAFFITAQPDGSITAGDFQLNTSIRWEGVA
jgi:hypothetical protein